MKYNKHYDVIVIGGGHAGIEAALAASRMGCQTLLLSINLDSVGWMPCNPAIGGPGKSHIVSEIDALGGEMAKAADQTYMQMKQLNASKGPAVRALRAQSDKYLYHHHMKEVLENQPNLDLKQELVTEILVDNSNVIKGIKTYIGVEYSGDNVVVTTGTFLKGLIHIGLTSHQAGRLGEQPSNELSDSLRSLGLNLGRLKTGTTPRVHAKSVDFAKLKLQPGDDELRHFSFFHQGAIREQVPCHSVSTNEKTHEIILSSLDRSPMYTGKIEGVGPRYCPSVEDKIVRFKDKPSHSFFVEPEGARTHELYIQGFNTSLPLDVQIKALQSMVGFEEAYVTRPGYAIEYDFVFPYQLKYSFETKSIGGLFLAGQINGTSGYEEAAGQGLIAGTNAALRSKKKEPLILQRNESYLGILIDDLINKDIQEPYRMMTGRAEYRLILRQDNADKRLLEKAYQIGLVKKDIFQKYTEKHESIKKQTEYLKKTHFFPNEETNTILESVTKPIKKKTSFAEILRRPEIAWDTLASITENIDPEFPHKENVETDVKYEGYIDRVHLQAEKNEQNEKKRIPDDIDFMSIEGLRNEAKEKLTKIRPKNLGQASRISGVNPADISVLSIYLYKKKHK